MEPEDWKWREERKWHFYELEKRRLRQLEDAGAISCGQYDIELRKVIERLKL